MPYRLSYDGSWALDLASVRQALEGPAGERIRAIVLINPNNPTGSYVHPEERGAILDLCSEHAVLVGLQVGEPDFDGGEYRGLEMGEEDQNISGHQQDGYQAGQGQKE